MVAWAPVPNAWPGSITSSTAFGPPAAAAGSHGGRTRSAGTLVPARRLDEHRAVELAPALGPVVRRPRSVEISTGASPAKTSEVGQRGQLAGRPVDGVLDTPIRELHLLDPGGRELQQLGQRQLRLLAGDADGEPDHAA